MILYLVKSAICAALLLLFYHLVLEKESIYKFNRLYLLGAIIFSLLVPFITSPFEDLIPQVPAYITLYDEQMPVTSAEAETHTYLLDTAPTTLNTLPAQETQRINWFLLVYILGVLILSFRFVWQILSFIKLIQNNTVIDQGYYRTVLLGEKSQPFAFLNYMFVPREDYFNKTIETEIWEHELTHIKEKHTLDILLVELIRILFWFNPLIYFYKKAIQLNHEFLADHSVLACSNGIAEYQNLLLRKSSGSTHLFELSSPLNYSMTKKRLIMMYRKTTILKGALIKSTLIPIVFLFTGLFGTRAGQDFDPSLDSLLSGNSPVDQYENYIIESLDVRKGSVILLEKLDVEGIKAAYDRLSEAEKEQVSYFPFLDDLTTESLQLLQGLNNPYRVEFKLTTPPAKKFITNAVWLAWLKEPAMEVWVDDEKIPTQNLQDYTPADFALYEVREDKKPGPDMGSTYNILLTSHAHYHQKYVMARKKVEVINAFYKKDSHISISTMTYSFRHGMEGVLTFQPENLPFQIIEELINPSSKDKMKSMINTNKEKGFFVTVKEDDNTKYGVVITNKE